MTAIATKPKYQWTKIRQVKRGHKFFKDENSGKISIADYSGGFPHHTEDGPLCLDASRDIQVGEFILVPVRDENDNERTVSVTPDDAAWLISEYGFNIIFGGTRFICEKIEDDVI